MNVEEQLDAVIEKLETELQQLKNNRSSAAGAAATADEPPPPEEEEEAPEDPASAFLDWSQQQAVLDAELEEQLRARLATTEQVNAELEQHIDTLRRVGASRRRVGYGAAALRQRIEERHHEQRRLYTALRREFNRVLRTIYAEDGFMSMGLLLDVLFTQFQDVPRDPYVPVTEDMFPEHLSVLERAGIVRFESGTVERRVRLVNHAVNLKGEGIVPPQEEDEIVEQLQSSHLSEE